MYRWLVEYVTPTGVEYRRRHDCVVDDDCRCVPPGWWDRPSIDVGSPGVGRANREKAVSRPCSEPEAASGRATLLIRFPPIRCEDHQAELLPRIIPDG